MKRLIVILALVVAACGGGGGPAAAPKTLVTMTGSGSQLTAPFDAPGQWQVEWSFDCTARGKPGVFGVAIEGDNGADVTSPVTPPTNTKASGSDYVYKSGHLHLGVIADDGCSWTVTAKG
jgi:hypothetical protein